MTREAFRELVKKGPVLLDGATGTNLQKAGMPVGVCPEQWILENSEVLIDLQKRYVEAGTDILFADRKSTRLNSSHNNQSRMPSSA